jgi:NAD(P)-dependent dehydrogenase (short-subunit alcohol dehydrogenase family)
MTQRLCEGRVVIVTGAGRGIGRQYALMLAAHGARVIVNDLGGARDGTPDKAEEQPAEAVVREIRTAGGEAVANLESCSDWKAAGRLVEQAVDTFGRLDALVNNAGILRDRMLTNMTEAEWDAVINVHLKGTFAPTHHAANHWKNRHKAGETDLAARIINTTSVSGVYGNIGQSNYGAAKAGIAAMTIIAARELQRYGITVNAISPHAYTRMTADLGNPSPEDIERRDPRWIAPVVVWLASRHSSAVTARVIEAGGGHLGITQGWHPGPSAPQVADPAQAGAILTDLVARAQPNMGMNGKPAPI